jgi:hypothetical protein
MPPRIAKLAGLGAFAACAGLAALYFGIVFISRPVARGGIDATNSAVAWIAVGGLILALIAAHVVIGKQLLRLAKGAEQKHPL